MSWSFSVTAVAKEEFDAAVDAATPTGDVGKPGNDDDVATAKAALKALAVRIKRDKVGGQASGHTLQPDEGSNWSDSLAASVYGTE